MDRIIGMRIVGVRIVGVRIIGVRIIVMNSQNGVAIGIGRGISTTTAASYQIRLLLVVLFSSLFLKLMLPAVLCMNFAPTG